MMPDPMSPTFDIPQPESTSSRWSTPSPPPPERSSSEIVQSTAHTLTLAPNPKNSQAALLTETQLPYNLQPPQFNLSCIMLSSLLYYCLKSKPRKSNSLLLNLLETRTYFALILFLLSHFHVFPARNL